jgi:hypothetical protein
VIIVPTDASAPLDPNDLPLGTAAFTGTVWVPGNAPGAVPPGQEIPVSGALVQMTPLPVIQMDEGVQCQLCVQREGRNALTDAKGRFELAELPAGTYWLSIRKGEFAKQVQVTIQDGELRELEAAITTLPSRYDPAQGTWVPRVAVATGVYDPIESVLGKMGLGGVDASGLWLENGPGAERVDIYDNGGQQYTKSLGSIAALVNDIEAMRRYQIIFIPCSNVAFDILQSPTVLANLRQYVTEGGKLYTTDWSASWHDNVFPQQVTLAPDVLDTPASAYDPLTNTWKLDQLRSSQGGGYFESRDAEALDQPLFDWLDGQIAPLDTLGALLTANPSQMTIDDSWVKIAGVVSTPVGLDMDGMLVTDVPKVLVQGSVFDSGDPLKLPLTVTYQPAGCGRVLYSSYHTAGWAHAGLTLQERILVYLIMELTVCREEPVPIEPPIR